MLSKTGLAVRIYKHLIKNFCSFSGRNDISVSNTYSHLASLGPRIGVFREGISLRPEKGILIANQNSFITGFNMKSEISSHDGE